MLGYYGKKLFAEIASRTIDLDGIITSRKQLKFILAYHRVLPSRSLHSERVQSAMWVSPETFEKQIQWMMSVGEIVTLKEILQNKSDVPRFCITFDDGWRDNYTVAFPILKKYNLKATIFLATEAVESGSAFWAERLIRAVQRYISNSGIDAAIKALGYAGFKRWGLRKEDGFWRSMDLWIEELKLSDAVKRDVEVERIFGVVDMDVHERDMMSWAEIQEMSNYGVDFQSHTHTHSIIKYLDDESICFELSHSKAIIEDRLGKTVDIFCYPNARYPVQDKSQIYGRCGYKYGIKIDNQRLADIADPFRIPRLLMSEDNSGSLPYLRLRLLGFPKY